MHGETITAYHGTASSSYATIMREGLKPIHAGGADKWAAQHGMEVVLQEAAKHKPSVYVTTRKTNAESFARLAAEVNPGANPVVLTLEIPAKEFSAKFKDDEGSEHAPDGTPANYRSESLIPASWIKACKRILQRSPFLNMLLA